MKKALALILVLVTIIAAAAVIKIVGNKIETAYNSGFEAGVQHAIKDAELWVEIRNGIVEILIDIDGEVYVHEAEGGEL